MNVAREQTLAEHQYNVAILTQELCRRLGYAQSVGLQLLALALVHDAGECKTGDIPTPAKKLMRKACGPTLDACLNQFDVEDTSGLPDPYRAVLKCADYLDSMLFLRENKVGRHANAVFDDIIASASYYFGTVGDVGDHAAQLYRDLKDVEYVI